MDIMVQLKYLAEVALAMLLGGLIGVEREFAGKPAGLRTLMLVAGSAALLMIIGDIVMYDYAHKPYDDLISLDPIRIIQSIIIGISFLGAGTIILRQEKEKLEGLTTAAAILIAGTIGISIGLHLYVLATGISILSLIVMSGLRFTDRWIIKKREKKRNRNH
jgi:putative Mg2+ transporter-C (MgtC) family protein